MKILDRLQHGWNAFINNKDPTIVERGIGYSYRPTDLDLQEVMSDRLLHQSLIE